MVFGKFTKLKAAFHFLFIKKISIRVLAKILFVVLNSELVSFLFTIFFHMSPTSKRKEIKKTNVFLANFCFKLFSIRKKTI
jgi:hypothetical protein